MKPAKDKQRLTLDRARIRVLAQPDLTQVNGGKVPNQTRGPKTD